MSNGVLLIASNNGSLDYIKQAYELAKRVRKYLDLPTSIITTNFNYLEEKFADYNEVFDKVITVDDKSRQNNRIFFDGLLSQKTLSFKNNLRSQAYDLSPYDKTLLIDTDYIICNDILKNCFIQNEDVLLYKNSLYLGNDESRIKEFRYVSNAGVDFYWATCVYFTKSKKAQVLFDLVKHIQENYYHYVSLYTLPNNMFRNDYAFSIAIHILNGFKPGKFVSEPPGKMLYILDSDVATEINKDKIVILTGKTSHPGEYIASHTQGLNVHVMNKFALERIYSGDEYEL